MNKAFRGVDWGTDETARGTVAPLSRSIAVVVGIDAYRNGIAPLRTAVNDARRLASLLRRQHGYSVYPLIADVTAARLLNLLRHEIRPTESDRVLFYFAGHGIALDGDGEDGAAVGPNGYLIPQDAHPMRPGSFVSMRLLDEVLSGLACRHLLVILDCCFAGSFRWAGAGRDIPQPPRLIHRQRYRRYIRDPAWQVITSAAHDERALDMLGRHGEVDDEEPSGPHSPFALALIKGLLGAADQFPDGGDGLLTATELYLYLREWVSSRAEAALQPDQTPGIWPLRRHDKGEFVFIMPGKEAQVANLPEAPALTERSNPYRGLEPFERDQAELYFGRRAARAGLAAAVAEQPLTVVLGLSGSGKSSLVRAGLMADLDGKPVAADDASPSALRWACPKVAPFRPGNAPQHAFASYLAGADGFGMPRSPGGAVAQVRDWLEANPQRRLLIVVDQLEELLTLCRDATARDGFLRQLERLLTTGGARLRLVFTLRSDFEPAVRDHCLRACGEGCALDRHWRGYTVSALTNDELRQAIEGPAERRVLFFEPPSLPQTLIDEVQRSAAALPLISFTLSELYKRRDDSDRTLTAASYHDLGRIVGSLRTRANEEYAALRDDFGPEGRAHQATMRRLLMRMLAFEGGELTRRRAPQSELVYALSDENRRMAEVIQRLDRARLIVSGSAENAWGEIEGYWEPAHDALVNAWDRLIGWYAETSARQTLLRRITQAAGDWQRTADDKQRRRRLWHDDPRLEDAIVLSAKPERSIADERSEVGAQERPPVVARAWRRLFPELDHAPGDPLLNATETCFVRESERLRSKRLLRTIATVAVVMAGLLLLVLTANLQRERAEDQRRIATVRSLVSESRSLAESDPVRALLLGLEAHRIATEAGDISVKDAEQTISDQLRWIGGWPLSGHDKSITALAFDRTGRWLASGSDDATARVWDLSDPGAPPVVLSEHTSSVEHLAFDPHGRWVATSGQVDRPRLWDFQAPQPTVLARVGKVSNKYSVRLDPHGRWFVNAGSDGKIRLWPLVEGNPSPRILDTLGDGATAPVFDASGRWLAATAVGDDTEAVLLWDLQTATSTPIVLQDSRCPVSIIVPDQDGRWLATGGLTDTGCLWDLDQPRSDPRLLRQHAGAVTGIDFDPGKRWLVTSDWFSTLRFWKPEQRDSPWHILPASSGSIGAGSALSPDGHWIAAFGSDNAVRLWRAHKPIGQPLVLRGHVGMVDRLQFGPNGRWLATGSRDGGVRLWPLEQPTATPRLLPGGLDDVDELVIDPSGRFLLAADSDGALWRWSLGDSPTEPSRVGTEPVELGSLEIGPRGHWLVNITPPDESVLLWDLTRPGRGPLMLHDSASGIDAAAFDPHGRWLIAWDGIRGRSILWELTRPTPKQRELPAMLSRDDVIAFDPTGQWLATARSGDKIRLWDWKHLGTEPQRLIDGFPGTASGLVFGPRGHWLATSYWEDEFVGVGLVWDLQRPDQPVRKLMGHQDSISDMRFGPKGRWLATVSDDATVRVWDLRDPDAPARVMGDRTFSVGSIWFDHDGTMLTTTDSDGVARTWELERGRLESVLSLDYDETAALVFDPKGRWIITATDNGDIRLWPRDMVALRDAACRIAGRPLSREEWKQSLGDAPYQAICARAPATAVNRDRR